jgi:hypothetical protein
MRFRDPGTASSPRQQAARRLAEIEREIRDIKRLFPDLTSGLCRYRPQHRTTGRRGWRTHGESRAGRYLIH